VADGDFLIQIVAKLRDDTAAGIAALKRNIADLEGHAAAVDLSQGVGDLADEADRAAESHKDLNKGLADTERQAKRTGSEVDSVAESHADAAEKTQGHAGASSELADAQREVQAELPKTAKAVDEATRSIEANSDALSGQAGVSEEMKQGLKDTTTETTKLTDAQKELATRTQEATATGEALVQRMRSFDSAAKNNTASNKELVAGYGQIADGLKSVIGNLEVGSREFERFGSAMDEANKKAKNVDLARSSSGIQQWASELSNATEDILPKIISLSAALRGIRLVAIGGFLQPLITGFVALGAGLFSVAAGAVQAASALGGALVSSLGQLIPVAALAVAAVSRLQAVFAAVKAAQTAQATSNASPNQGAITQLQNTNSLIEAENNLKNAYLGLQDAQIQVRESQQSLTQSRIDAIRNLQDLVIAEQSAKLAMSESNLGVQQARQALAAAQGTGSQEGIEQAKQGLQAAEIQRETARNAVPRARQDLRQAQHYGVDGSPGVLSAAEAARQARQNVAQQRAAIADAQRQNQIAKLTAAEPSSNQTSQQTTLNQMLGHLSPVEKQLYSELDRLDNELQSPTGPLRKITDHLVQPFVYAFGQIQKLIDDPKFLSIMNTLGATLGRSLDSITKVMFGQRGKSFLETMAEDATRSAPVITSSITGIMKVLEDVATAAAPAMLRLSEDWARFWNAMDARDSSDAGQKRLTDFFMQGAKWAEDFAHLSRAVVDLFMALGHDAAPQGMKSITSLSDSVEGATTWITGHKSEVTSFFTQVNQALSLIGGTLLQVGKFLVSVFSVSSLSAFTSFLTTIILPAMHDFVIVVGTIVQGFTRLVNALGPLRVLLEAMFAGGITLVALSKLVTAVSRVTDVFYGARDAMKAFQLAGDASVFSKLGAAWDALTSRVKDGKTAINEATAAQKEMATVSDTTSASEVADQEAVNAARSAGSSAGVGSALTGAGGGAASDAEIGGGAVAGAEGTSLLGALGPAALVGGGGAALIAALFSGSGPLATHFTQGEQNTTSVGDLAASLGTVGQSQSNGSGYNNAATLRFGLDSGQNSLAQGTQISGTNAMLKQLQEGLKGVTNPASLSQGQLTKFYDIAQKTLQMPDITAVQRQGLTKLSQELDPVNQKIAQMNKVWGSTFSGISSTTGNVLSQVKATMSTDIASISANLGTGTKTGAQALTATVTGAWSTILANTSAAARGTQSGLKSISTMFEQALKSLGITNVPKSLANFKTFNAASAALGAGESTSMASASAIHDGSLTAQGYATGGIPVMGRPTGTVINQPTYITGEEAPTHPEYVLATNPAYRQKNVGLWANAGKALGVPGFAQGGVVGEIDDFFAQKGVSKIGISGIIGNWMQESTLNPDLTGASGLGLAQWIGSRRTAAYALAARMKTAPTNLMLQLQYAWQELTGPYRSTLSQIQGARSPAQAAQLFEQGYEGAGIPSMANRIRYAQEAFAGDNLTGGDAHFGGSGGAAGVSSMIAGLKAPRLGGASVGLARSLGQGVLANTINVANSILSRLGGSPSTATSLGSSGAGGSGGGAGGGLPSLASLDIPAGSVNTPTDSWNASRKPIATWITPILKWAAAHGWSGQVDSGYRSYADQEFLYTHAGTDGISSIVARPGTSNHEKSVYPGGAVDVDGASDSMLMRVLQGYRGMQKLVGGYLGPADPYHFSADGRRTGGVIYAANGFSGTVDRPTMFMTGEGPGKEDVHVIPHYATGGVYGGLGATGARAAQASSSSGTNPLASVEGFLSGMSSNLYKMDPGGLVGALPTLSKLFSVVSSGFSKIGKLGGDDTARQVSEMSGLIEGLADPNNQDSTLNQLATALQRYQQNLADWVTSSTYVAGKLKGSTRLAGPALSASNVGDAGSTRGDLLNERSLTSQSSYLGDESRTVGDAVKQVRESISRVRQARNSGAISKGTAKSALNKLESNYTELIQQQQSLSASIDSVVTSRFQAQQQYVQDLVSQVGDVYQTQQSGIQNKQTNAETLGNFGAAGRSDTSLGKSYSAQIKALQKPLDDAKANNDSDAVAQITQQINQLKTSVVSTASQLIQDQVSAIQQSYQTSGAKLQTRQSNLQTLGDYSQLPSVDEQVAQSAKDQISALQKPLEEAKKSHNSAAAASIEQQISSLQSTVAQSLAQVVQDQLSGVEQQFANKSADQGMSQSIAQTNGRFDLLGGPNGIDAQIVSTTNDHIAALQGVLAAAQKDNNQGLASQIQQEIDQLQTTVAQTTAQMIQDSMSAISQGAQTQQAQVSLGQTLAQVAQGAASSSGQFASAGAQNLAALNLNQSSLQSQLSGYNSLLGTAVSSGNASAVATLTQTIDQLTGQLAQNAQAIDDNTAQVVAQTSSYIQSRGQFTSGVYGGLASIVSTLGATTGSTDVASLASLTNASSTSLQGTNTGLLGQLAALGGGAGGLASTLGSASTPSQFVAALSGANIGGIESGQDSTWISTFESIVSSLESNTEAIATNSQTLATLNGQLSQPQQWATSIWQAYRTAVFSGMGTLLPSYASTLSGTSAMPTIAPAFGTSTPSSTIGTLNINHAPASSVSPSVLGEQLAHEFSGALT
jgi:hypothetical protein